MSRQRTSVGLGVAAGAAVWNESRRRVDNWSRSVAGAFRSGEATA